MTQSIDAAKPLGLKDLWRLFRLKVRQFLSFYQMFKDVEKLMPQIEAWSTSPAGVRWRRLVRSREELDALLAFAVFVELTMLSPAEAQEVLSKLNIWNAERG